jgi:hypothetical protein
MTLAAILPRYMPRVVDRRSDFRNCGSWAQMARGLQFLRGSLATRWSPWTFQHSVSLNAKAALLRKHVECFAKRPG